MPSRRSQFLVKFFEKGKRVSKEDLIEKGIYRPEAVFGNFLVNLCHTTSGIPDFLARCVARIDDDGLTVIVQHPDVVVRAGGQGC